MPDAAGGLSYSTSEIGRLEPFESGYGPAMTTIEVAEAGDIEALVNLEGKLFAEDAARHDPFADISWPQRLGHDDFARLLASDSSLVLVARADAVIIGYLDGYTFRSSPTRQPVLCAELRSMYIEAAYRRSSFGRLLTEQFVSWARARSCVEVHVDCYTANHAAQHFYQASGFDARSVQRVLRL